MVRLKGLSQIEVDEITRQIADAFFDYQYNEVDEGLIKYISDRESMHNYIGAIVKAAYNSGLMYATSPKREGYLFLTGDGVGTIRFMDGMKMIVAEKKALGSFHMYDLIRGPHKRV